MCASSYVGDYARDTLPGRYPNIIPQPLPYQPGVTPITQWPPIPSVSRAEFDALKTEVEELKKLLAAAKKYDEATGQRECEQAEKIAFLKKLAEFVGIDLSEAL